MRLVILTTVELNWSRARRLYLLLALPLYMCPQLALSCIVNPHPRPCPTLHARTHPTDSSYDWAMSAWGACTPSEGECGRGAQKRDVFCTHCPDSQQFNHNMPADITLCDNATRPVATQDCSPGDTGRWSFAYGHAVGSCECLGVPCCGDGLQAVTVSCLRCDGLVMPNASQCVAQSIPIPDTAPISCEAGTC